MSGLMKSVLAAALTLPLVAFVAGVLASPDDPARNRARPVIIGNVGDDVQDGPTLRPRAPRQSDSSPDPGPPTDDGRADDDDDEPAAVIPPPRDVDDDNDDVGDDGDDDDETDDDGGDDD